MEKSSHAEDLLKNQHLRGNHLRNPGSDLASSNNNVSISLKDYEWKKVTNEIALDE